MGRKRYTPLSLPQQNPQHHRFQLPNAILKHKLTPKCFVVLAYLYYHFTHRSGAQTPTPKMIAETAHMTIATVRKSLTTLMSKQLITTGSIPTLKQDDREYFTLPNEIFMLALSPSALVVYAYLLLIEDRRTHTCHPSYKKIGAAVGLQSVNTVRKYVTELAEQRFVKTEPTTVLDRTGHPQNGNLLYTILPIKEAVDCFHERQIARLELEAERQRAMARLAKFDRVSPQEPLCAALPETAGTDPSQG